MGGRYEQKKKPEKLQKWREEQWVDVYSYVKNNKIIECGSDKLDRHACRPLKPKNKTLSLDDLIKKHGKKKMLELVEMKRKDDAVRINWAAGKKY